MAERRNRRRRYEEEPENSGSIFIQLLVCIALVCCFMFFKDTPLPNGKTAAHYAKHFLEYTVDFSEITARFKEEGVPANSTAIEEVPPMPTPIPEETEEE